MQLHTGIDIVVRTGIDIGVRGSGLVENNTRRKATALAAAGGEVVNDTGLEILISQMRVKDTARLTTALTFENFYQAQQLLPIQTIPNAVDSERLDLLLRPGL